MVKIGVLGAGSWGLGLAMLLHNNGHDVTVWSVFPDEINELNATRENKKCLPGVIFPESVKFCADTEKVVTESDVLILAAVFPYCLGTEIFLEVDVVCRTQAQPERAAAGTILHGQDGLFTNVTFFLFAVVFGYRVPV